MKICTITCSCADNHGARIQTAALARFLSDMGHQVEVIDFQPAFMRFELKYLYFPGSSLKEWLRLVFRMRYRHMMIRRHRGFVDFDSKFIPLSGQKYLSVSDLQENPPSADAYIVGSDQVWNPDFPNGKDPAFYLDFGSAGVRRISYAASFAVPRISEAQAAFVKRKLAAFDAVSVRERSGASILGGIGVDAAVVCDPVFLLQREYWLDEVAAYPARDEDYILVYDFEGSAEVKRMALKLSHMHKLRIFSVSPYGLSYANRNFTYCTPQEFIGLVAKARIVVSNSFHGTAFAILFGRDFFVVNRNDGLNERMADLLSRYGLSHRIVSDSTHDSILSAGVDYEAVEPVLRADIDFSKSWIRNALC